MKKKTFFFFRLFCQLHVFKLKIFVLSEHLGLHPDTRAVLFVLEIAPNWI